MFVSRFLFLRRRIEVISTINLNVGIIVMLRAPGLALKVCAYQFLSSCTKRVLIKCGCTTL